MCKKNKTVLLYHHLGLGDHIICHGIVRHYCKKYDMVHIFCKHHNMQSILDMFDDIENLTVLACDNDETVHQYIKNNQKEYDKIKIISATKSDTLTFEQQFYKKTGLKLDRKWDYFFIPQLPEEKLQLKDFSSLKNYILIHDDIRYPIKHKKIPNEKTNLYIKDIEADSIIQFIDLIKRASEIHVIDSAFLFLIDCLKYNSDRQKLFIHRYSRQNPLWCLPTLRKNWTIIQ